MKSNVLNLYQIFALSNLHLSAVPLKYEKCEMRKEFVPYQLFWSPFIGCLWVFRGVHNTKKQENKKVIRI